MSTFMAPEVFDDAVRAYCTRYPASVISGGRTRKHTIAVGGFAGDPHEAWFAVDVQYDEVPDYDEAHAFGLTLGLKVLREGHANGDHLQPVDWLND